MEPQDAEDVTVKVEIREAAPGDAPAITRLLDALGYPDSEPAVQERVAWFAESAHDHVIVAEADGALVGVLALSLTRRFAEPGWFSRITAIAVYPSERRTGVGRRLVATAEDIARRSGSTLMQVNSGRRPERDDAHASYRSLGYQDQHTHHILYDKQLTGSSFETGSVDGA